ncbi:MAG: recombination regulator RecX [Vallitalea sp.]|nr:recombination regulator RecX [Vallitalea sp.]
MIITQIVQNKRFKNYYDIYIDEEYQFFITYTELKFLKLQENNNITKESLELIYREYVYKRAKNRAFRLLQRKDMTRKEMISKLEISRYNEYIIDSVINFLEEYRYINDREYAIKYISYNKTRKSIKQISIELVRKGIDKEVIKELLEDTEICEEDIAYSLLIKKYRNIDSIDNKIKNRMLGYIMRKGYSYNIAIKTINRLKDEKDL